MKKRRLLWILLPLLAVATCVTLFAACGDDDEDYSAYEGQIIGTWYGEGDDEDEYMFDFRKNHTGFCEVDYYEFDFTWKMTDEYEGRINIEWDDDYYDYYDEYYDDYDYEYYFMFKIVGSTLRIYEVEEYDGYREKDLICVLTKEE